MKTRFGDAPNRVFSKRVLVFDQIPFSQIAVVRVHSNFIKRGTPIFDLGRELLKNGLFAPASFSQIEGVLDHAVVC